MKRRQKGDEKVMKRRQKGDEKVMKRRRLLLTAAVNCLALCLTAYTANLACNWLYYQEDEPEEVKKMRKF